MRQILLLANDFTLYFYNNELSKNELATETFFNYFCNHKLKVRTVLTLKLLLSVYDFNELETPQLNQH